MESIYTELAICGSKNLFPRTDTALFAISEVSDGTVSLTDTDSHYFKLHYHIPFIYIEFKYIKTTLHITLFSFILQYTALCCITTQYIIKQYSTNILINI